MEDPELEALRQKRMAELQQEQTVREDEAQRFEMQKQAVLRQILTPEARDRLANIKLANPDQANAVEMQLIQIAQSGRIQGVIDDNMLREVLQKIIPRKREINIQRR
jgi:programmed cell death protein 5